jgi:hypothetical protein
MKICILSIGRAGSTSLYKTIKEHLTNEYYCIAEPFNSSFKRVNPIEKNQFDYISKKDKVLIKTIINFKPEDMNEENFYDWIFTFFDKVILLDRLDNKSQIESFSYLIHTKSKSWHKKQFFDMSLISPDVIKEWDVNIRNHKKTMNDLCVKYNKKIYYYEDIFLIKNPIVIDEIFEYLEIIKNPNIVEKYILSDEHKVRMDKRNNKLI